MMEKIKNFLNKKIVLLILGIIIGVVVTASCFKIFARPNHKMMNERMQGTSRQEMNNPNQSKQSQGRKMNNKNNNGARNNKNNSNSSKEQSNNNTDNTETQQNNSTNQNS